MESGPCREEVGSAPTAAQALFSHVDVVIVGAGLSGIGAACHLRKRCPDQTVAILEARGAIGGTWDHFRYPGVRSDSDMQTLGYGFRPWLFSTSIADGCLIRRYIQATAAANGVDNLIRFGNKVVRASWSSDTALWTLEVDCSAENRTSYFTCRFLLMCSGYYSYDEAHHPDIPKADLFAGQIVHPQFWPPEIDYAGKEVVVIGSGSTAVTIVPAMSNIARHVTMLQRSPTYVISRPAIDPWVSGWRTAVVRPLVVRLSRAKNVVVNALFYEWSRRAPDRVRRYLLQKVRSEVGETSADANFNPRYAPWDQRLCAVPDGDLFEALREGRASVITDQIAEFTTEGLRLRSGRELKADIIVTATGLKLNFLGDVQFTIDGRKTTMSKHVLYKGAMLSSIPNLFMFFGYTNASWTLKTDLVSAFICRVLNTMRRRGCEIVTPAVAATGDLGAMIDLSSGYVQRARDLLPRQGAKGPWRLRQRYWSDFAALRFGRLDDGVLTFGHATRGVARYRHPACEYHRGKARS